MPREVQKFSVMISHDDPSQIKKLQKLIDEQYFILRKAISGSESLEIIANEAPDLIVLGITECRPSVFDWLTAFSEFSPSSRTPLIVIADPLNDEEIEQLMSYGVEDIWFQPINAHLFTKHIEKIIQVERQHQQFKNREQYLLQAQGLSRMLTWVWNFNQKKFQWLNRGADSHAGYLTALDKMTVDDNLLLIHPEDQPTVRAAREAAFHQAKTYELEYRLMLPEIGTFHIHEKCIVELDAQGTPIYMLGTIRDITARKNSEKEVQQLAYYDCLTGLPNRFLFQEYLEIAINHASRSNQSAAIMFLDLDDFKQVNDSLGHATGDQLLQQVSERLILCLRDSDFITRSNHDDRIRPVARLGGDEFTILLLNNIAVNDITNIAQRIIDELNKPYYIDSHEVTTGVSIGIVMFPFDGDDSESILNNADTAMYYAKQQGKNNFCFYDQKMNTIALQRMSMERDMRAAFERNHFTIYYQPRVLIPEQKVTGIEALIRWQHPEHGLIPAEKFIPLAEETNLIMTLGELVIHRSFNESVQCQQNPLDPLPLSFNLSERQLSDPRLLQKIHKALEVSHVDPRDLEIEIKADLIIEKDNNVFNILRELKSMGASIYIDDFGKGYSSLQYLSNFPFDGIKIDQSFVHKIAEDPASAAVVKAIITLGHGLDAHVVAEGVEDERQYQLLSEFGCTEMQGNYFAEAMPITALRKFLSKPFAKSA